MSKIEWTEQTWNPIVGCSKVSAGCKNCYAEVMARRLAAMGKPQYQAVIGGDGHWNGNVEFVPAALQKPVNRKKPTVWFVNSMSDMFHPAVEFNHLRYIWQVMADTPQHTYQILTKRADRMAVWVPLLAGEFGVLPNVWLGVSAENQQTYEDRVMHLASIPAVLRFISCEPLLSDIFLHLDMPLFCTPTGDAVDARWLRFYNVINWVIVGGESGPHARPMHPDWARSLRDQCIETHVPFFFKQWGEWIEYRQAGAYGCRTVGNRGLLSGGEFHGQQFPLSYEWGGLGPPMVKVGKKAAGSLLDGVEWKQYPDGVGTGALHATVSD